MNNKFKLMALAKDIVKETSVSICQEITVVKYVDKIRFISRTNTKFTNIKYYKPYTITKAAIF